MAQTKLPYICRGSYDSLVASLDDGVFKDLDRTMFVLLTDEPHYNMFAFVTPEKKSNWLSGITRSMIRTFRS